MMASTRQASTMQPEGSVSPELGKLRSDTTDVPPKELRA